LKVVRLSGVLANHLTRINYYKTNWGLKRWSDKTINLGCYEVIYPDKNKYIILSLVNVHDMKNLMQGISLIRFFFSSTLLKPSKFNLRIMLL